MKNIIIFGASGHGGVVLDCLEKEGKYNVVGFLDSFKKKGRRHCGYEILGSEFDLPYLVDKYNIVGGIIAIGDNWIRKAIVERICSIVPDFDFISTLHPSVIKGRNVTIGRGVVVMPGVVINSNTEVGDFCILNTFSSLDHDSQMHEYSSLAPRVCIGGGFNLGKFSAICLGTHIIENITIGEHTVVGAGSLVVKDIEPLVLSYGSPSRIIRTRQKGDPYLAMARSVIKPVVSSIASNF
jgi:sugar O-acyltransferase (sialic acid O-acetyltransferase NeuD family)